MKKTYLPFGKIIIIYGAVFLASIGIFLYITLSGFDILRFIIVLLLMLLVGYYFISPILIYRVTLTDKTISIHKDFGLFKEDRIQKAVAINYEDIKEYKVIMSDRDSEGQAYESKAPKKEYIEFVLNDDSVKRIFVSNMAKSQVKAIVSRIKEYTGKDITTSKKEEKAPEAPEAKEENK